MPKIVVGRDDDDQEKYGLKGTGMIGRHLVGENEEAHMANPVYLDLARPHVMGIFGKRGTGKSYSLGLLAEEIQDSEISDNLSTIIIDSMGIYWSMERPNERAAGILEEWDLKPERFDPTIFVPKGRTEELREKNIPFDETFSLDPSELSSSDWQMALNVESDSEMGILLDQTITKLKEQSDSYKVEHIIKGLKQLDFSEDSKRGLENRLRNAQDWGIFGESGMDKFMERGGLSIIDMSVFGGMESGWSVRGLVVGLLARKILRRRMDARKVEELDEMEGINENEMPITWMLIDEAHQFLPDEGETPASRPLLRWAKVGREPGVSMVLATQQPGRLHENVLSQCDLVLSHRLTAQQDLDALSGIMQSYMRQDLSRKIDGLPDEPGAGVILDDNSERSFSVKMRPRKSWHAGGTPDAFGE